MLAVLRSSRDFNLKWIVFESRGNVVQQQGSDRMIRRVMDVVRTAAILKMRRVSIRNPKRNQHQDVCDG